MGDGITSVLTVDTFLTIPGRDLNSRRGAVEMELRTGVWMDGDQSKQYECRCDNNKKPIT